MCDGQHPTLIQAMRYSFRIPKRQRCPALPLCASYYPTAEEGHQEWELVGSKWSDRDETGTGPCVQTWGTQNSSRNSQNVEEGASDEYSEWVCCQSCDSSVGPPTRPDLRLLNLIASGARLICVRVCMTNERVRWTRRTSEAPSSSPAFTCKLRHTYTSTSAALDPLARFQ